MRIQKNKIKDKKNGLKKIQSVIKYYEYSIFLFEEKDK